HRHGVRSRNAAAAASTPKPIAIAKPDQMPNHSFGRFTGCAISATDSLREATSPIATILRRRSFPEQRADRMQKLDKIERLGQLAIDERAELDRPARLIAIVVDRAHQQDRGRLARGPALDLADELEAVLARQLDVDEQQIRRVAIEPLDALGPR